MFDTQLRSLSTRPDEDNHQPGGERRTNRVAERHTRLVRRDDRRDPARQPWQQRRQQRYSVAHRGGR